MKAWFRTGRWIGLILIMGAAGTPRPLQARSLDECAADSLRVPILVYHNVAPDNSNASAAQREFNVSPAAFLWQMSYLRDRGIAVVSLGRLVDALEGRNTIQDPAVVITFDDGWVGQHRNAFPILQRFGYTATFFVFTNPIDRDARWMTWEQLLEMTAAGMTIASHTRTHPKITKVQDREELRKEIAGSRELLQRKLGVAVDYFSYPYGVVTPAVVTAVREAGYRAARAFPGGVWNHGCNVWALRSVHVTADSAWFRRIVDPPGTRR